MSRVITDMNCSFDARSMSVVCFIPPISVYFQKKKWLYLNNCDSIVDTLALFPGVLPWSAIATIKC